MEKTQCPILKAHSYETNTPSDKIQNTQKHVGLTTKQMQPVYDLKRQQVDRNKKGPPSEIWRLF